MNTKDSNQNEKSINNLKGDAVNGNEIIGGGKMTPIVVAPEGIDTPQGVNIPGMILAADPSTDFAIDGNVKPINVNGGAELQ